MPSTSHFSISLAIAAWSRPRAIAPSHLHRPPPVREGATEDRWLPRLGAAVVAAAGLLAASCSAGGPVATFPGAKRPAAFGPKGDSPGPSGGTFDLLTYNVAGLPHYLSSSDPVRNTPRISRRLDAYDLALVQEDFRYHAKLARHARHPFRSRPLRLHAAPVGDGLNRFSTFPFAEFERIRWDECHGIVGDGSDCLSAKGFSLARHEISPGVVIDVYNLHADAGGAEGDIEARAAQFRQLRAHLARVSHGNAVIVAGDTNLKGAARPRDGEIMAGFLGATGMADVARFLGGFPETIDRVFFRSGAGVALRPLRWRIADEFVDGDGAPLSDHEPIHARFAWRRMR